MRWNQLKAVSPDSLSTLNNGVSLRSWILCLPPLEQRSSMWRASLEGVNLKILEQTHCMIFWFIETVECPSLTAWWWYARLERISSVPWFTISAPLLPVRFGCFIISTRYPPPLSPVVVIRLNHAHHRRTRRALIGRGLKGCSTTLLHMTTSISRRLFLLM